jgi:hypothetical protein
LQSGRALGKIWELGKHKMPGNIAVGAWNQTGKLTGTNNTVEKGAQGLYAYGFITLA